MTTECWLLKESRYESMILNVVDILFLQCTLTATVTEGQLVVLIIFHIILVFSHFLCLLSFFFLAFNVKETYESQEDVHFFYIPLVTELFTQKLLLSLLFRFLSLCFNIHGKEYILKTGNVNVVKVLWLKTVGY